jgi:hypothetical protein
VRPIEYPIAGTPCEKSMGHAFGFFPSGVCKRFPDDTDLQALQPEGYAASTLTDAAGKAIGLVWVMSKRELANRALTETVLKIFAARIGSEIERQQAAQAVRASDAQYRAMFDAAADSLVLRDADFRHRRRQPGVPCAERQPSRRRDRHHAPDPPRSARPGRAHRRAAPARTRRRARAVRKRRQAHLRRHFHARGARRADDASGTPARALRLARRHRAQDRGGAAPGERGAVPGDFQRLGRRDDHLESRLSPRRCKPGVRAHLRLHARGSDRARIRDLFARDRSYRPAARARAAGARG